MARLNRFCLARSATTDVMQAVASQARYSVLSIGQESNMRIWVRRQAGVPIAFFRQLVGWMFAFAILVLWIPSAGAESITLRVVAATPLFTAEGRPSFYIELDDDAKRTLGQFTIEHVGEDIEVRSEGRLLMKARLLEPILGGVMQIGIFGDFNPDEVASLPSRLATDGKIEINALGRPQK
jgi:hypothetical protein